MKPFDFLANDKFRKRFKQLGVIAFLFFLIKGLLWLIIPALLIYFGYSGIDW